MRLPRRFWRSCRLLVLIGPLVAALLGVAGKGVTAADAEKGERFSVTASVQQGAGFIQAELAPGLFTVREGFQASNLKFSYHDPKTGIQRNKLGPRDIYSVTQRRYIHEVVSDPLFALPPGEYKLAVGGQPGATGILGYTLAPKDPGKPGEKDGPTTVDQGKRPVPPRDNDRRRGDGKTTGDGKTPPSDSTKGTAGGASGTSGTRGLPRDFDIVCNEGPFQEHPLVFRFRGDQFTVQSQFEVTYPIAEGGKSVYTYQTEITGSLRQGKAEGKYTYYATGGHFGTTPFYSVGLYYKAWIRGDVTGRVEGDGLLKLVIDMNRHKHIDRVIPAKPEWGPWKDNTAMMEDASKVASPWRPGKMEISLRLPVGQTQASQKLVPEKPFQPIPNPD